MRALRMEEKNRASIDYLIEVRKEEWAELAHDLDFPSKWWQSTSFLY